MTPSIPWFNKHFIYRLKNGNEDDDIVSYKIVFDLFDKDRSGNIDHSDLKEIAISLNRDPDEGTI